MKWFKKWFKKWKWQSTEYFEFMKKKYIFENVMAIFFEGHAFQRSDFARFGIWKK